MEYLIHTYKFFSVIHTILQLDHLPQLHKRVISSLQILNHQTCGDQTPLSKCANNQQVYSEEEEEVLDLKPSKSCSMEEQDSSLVPGISSPSADPIVLSTGQRKVLRYISDVIQSLVVSCDPLFMSGMCRLIFNFILAFPKLIGHRIHEDATIGVLLKYAAASF